MKQLKIRTSFVTNSSSSSFIVAYKPLSEIDEDTIKKYPFLKNYNDMIKSILLFETEWTSKGYICEAKDEVDDYLLDEYYCDSIEELKEEIGDEFYTEIIKYVNDGYNILFKSVEYQDDCFIDIIKGLNKDNDNFVILEEIS